MERSFEKGCLREICLADWQTIEWIERAINHKGKFRSRNLRVRVKTYMPDSEIDSKSIQRFDPLGRPVRVRHVQKANSDFRTGLQLESAAKHRCQLRPGRTLGE